MEGNEREAYLERIRHLEDELYEANSIIDAIREGEVDALVLNRDGQQHIYALETADYTYRILIEKSGEGALSVSQDGLILYCNAYFATLAGLPASKIVGTDITDYVDQNSEFISMMKQVRRGPVKGEVVMNFEGRKIPAYVSMSDLRPHVQAIGIVVTDLTQAKKGEAALQQSRADLEKKVEELNLTNANLEQFVHVISHDIKEPIRKILTYTTHLTDTRSELFDATDLKQMEVINSSATRLNSLVDDLVTYAYSAVKADTREVALSKVLEEVVDDLEIIITESGTRINVAALPVIRASKVQMRQLFSNLLANAIKYSRKGVPPVITIDASEDENETRIRIADNGIGMEENQLGKIFTIFRRLHTRDQYSGNGIGLAICRKIMENHGGRIEVQSKLGHGTTFNLYFAAGR